MCHWVLCFQNRITVHATYGWEIVDATRRALYCPQHASMQTLPICQRVSLRHLAYQKGSLFLEGKFQTTILRVVNLTLLRDHVYYHVYSEINLVAYSRFASSSDMHCRTDSVQFQSSSNDSNVSPAKPQAFCWAFLQDSTICWENQYMCTAKVVTVRFCSNSFTCKR